MIINFLPEEHKKYIKYAFLLDRIGSYAVKVLAVFVLLNILIFLVSSFKFVAFKRAEALYAGEKGNLSFIESLKKEVATQRNEVEALKKMVFPDMYFSRIMYEVYEALPNSIWLSELEYKDNILFIAGSAVSYQQDAETSVSNFSQKLSLQKMMSEYFKQVKITSLKKEKINNINIVNFTLECK